METKMMNAHRTVAFVLLTCCGGYALAVGEEAAKEALHAYEQAWSGHDGHAVASFYYEPAMRVTKAGPVVRPSRADQEAFFKGFLRGLVERGYARSSWEQLEVRLLDPQTAIASGVTVRHRADGTVFERVAVTYGLRNTAEGWKIFLSATHEPETVLRFR
jgi:ketosteroid isomerase-like protein